MSERELRNMIDKASRGCEKLFASKSEIAPMWHAITAKGESLIQPNPVMFDKDTAIILIRLRFKLMDIVRYVYIGEAWTLERAGSTSARPNLRRSITRASPIIPIASRWSRFRARTATTGRSWRIAG
jgi:hypothetical protein